MGRFRHAKSVTPFAFCSYFRYFISAAILSQVMLFRYLSQSWPELKHPLEPPTSSISIPNKDETTRTMDTDSSDRKVDGYFNGFPIYYSQSTAKAPASIAHCIGENFEPNNAWMFRSCEYQNLCFDTHEKEFVFIQSSVASTLEAAVDRAASRPFVTISSLRSQDKSVSLGTLGPKISHREEESMKWSPKIIQEEEVHSATGFYQLPPNVVMLPIKISALDDRKENAQWVWDNLFPAFTLLHIFGLTGKEHAIKLLMVQHRDSPRKDSAMFLETFMSKDRVSIASSQAFHFEDSTKQQRSNLICSKHTLSGLGMIADRGFNMPERWRTTSPEGPPATLHAVSVNLFTHNMAQGKILKDFRNFMLNNLHVNPSPKRKPQIIFYGSASRDMITDVKVKLGAVYPDVSVVHIDSTPGLSSLASLAKAIAETSILIVDCCAADAAIAAIFLTLSSTLIINYDQEKYGIPLERVRAAFPIWDLLDNAAYIRPYWLAVGNESHLAQIVKTIQGELAIMEREP